MNTFFVKPKRFVSILSGVKSSTVLDLLILTFIILQLIGEMLGNIHLAHLKPIPVILIILKSIYLVQCDSNITRGLILCLIGDICLMVPSTLLLEVGAIFFLIGLTFYICSFIKNYHSSGLTLGFRKILAYLATFMIFIVFLVNSIILWIHLPLKSLFLLYGIVLSVMGASSFYRFRQKDLGNYWIGVIGSLCFLGSDYLNAYSKFMGKNSHTRETLIMLLYYLAQYLILKSNSIQKGQLLINR